MSACKKASTNTLNDSLADDTTAVLKYQGNFVSGPYGTVSGIAKIYLKQNKYVVGLENFSSSNGPDLKVYISKEQVPVNFIKLSDLSSTNGDQLYDVTGSPDFSEYKYVLIHCEQFNHLFGSALIQ
ncbi:MAG: DM13 domain-containing protein [Ferruginibacter sp.]